MYLNKVLLYGNLTRDVELKNAGNGTLVGAFGLATNRRFKNKAGEQQDQTEFHNVVAFGPTASVMGQYLKKGRPVFIEGRLQTRSWDDKETGKKVYRTEIVVDSFQFGPDGGQRTESQPLAKEFDKTPQDDKTYSPAITPPGGYPEGEINPEDIPF